MSRGTSSILILVFFLPFMLCQTPMNLMVVIEESDSSIFGILNDAVPEAERNFANDMITVHVSTVTVDRENVDASFEKVCAVLYQGISIVLDMTWTGWDKLRNIADERGIIYKRGDCSISPYIQAIDDLLIMKNATDVGLIFEDERELNQSLYYLIGNSILRLVVIDELTERTVAKIRGMRPSPSYYAIYASTAKMEELFKTAIGGGLVKREGIWNLIFTDNNYHEFRYITGDLQLNVSFTILNMKTDICCRLMGDVSCTCPSNFKIFPHYFKRLIGLIVSLMSDVQRGGVSVTPKTGQCDKSVNSTSTSNITVETFNKILMTRLDSNDTFEYWSEKAMITYKAELELQMVSHGFVDALATWTRRTKIKEADGRKIEPARRFFRIGTAPAIPWSVIKKDPVTGQDMHNEDAKEMWEGYCIDFIQKLSEEMQFDYDLIIPEDQEFGKKLPNGEWSGLIGDLAKGETDIAVAALTMTSEREEVIDFVAPYFEQSGILIVMRKPIRKTSLFKFMTVLRHEVWLSIVGALTLTGIMIWILDKYSPYSARNNKRLYPYPCREFTLKESFWFALTSFTPQGGGEAPKALSSRTLVAAYWLFVVLMLATFTANLAAFLTVERMQSPVQSLEQLARQSRINYTVLANSSAHQYFKNMKNAEDKLYTVWKEITLNSTSDQVEYRVWDYPIKEQYGHILQAITQVGPVKSTEDGFRKVQKIEMYDIFQVIESEEAEFAFIHDSSEIKYEVTKNCNLTEVGEVFAEQPYAIAVQQGSHLQEEISRKSNYEGNKDNYGQLRNPYRFTDEYFTDATHGVPTAYKNKGEKCDKIVKDSMVCMVCKDAKTNGKYEQCSYVKPHEKAYSYVKSSTFGKPQKSEENDSDERPDVESHEYSYPSEDYSEKTSVNEQDEVKDAPSSDCKQVQKDSKTCTVCKDSKTGGTYEKCTYNYQPSDKLYKYSRSKTFGFPDKTSDSTRDSQDSNKSEASEKSKNFDYSQDKSEQSTYPRKSNRAVEVQQVPNDSDGTSHNSPNYSSDYSNSEASDYQFPSYNSDSESYDGQKTSSSKPVSESYSENISSDNCKTLQKDSMTCKICKDPQTGNDFEQCSYSYQPSDKLFSYSTSRSFSTPQKSERTPHEDKHPSDSSEITKKSYDEYVPGLNYEASSTDEATSRDDAEGKKGVEAGYLDTVKKKAEIEEFMQKFQKEDRSNCKKIMRDKMTCYQCIDGEGFQKEECAFVTGQEPDKDQLVFHETKEFQVDSAPRVRDIKSSSSTKTKGVDSLEPSTSASKNSYVRVEKPDNDYPDEASHTAEETKEAEPYDYTSETRAKYDKVLRLTLPAYMSTTSEHEAAFDEIVASDQDQR
ncbi:Glutamate receptor, ionotropic kainate 2 [Cyphomyrmex costatus]|uniref:Glutamate receptor, ionotropic kainate 2 n=1 Tax=Cyphomyrmex costatus TaxID=456900 RepID=A0A195CUQ6_9HYME|nr:Glutamate receptor, ionotropic kainate 2 [Cyphomyrmex costatus]